MSASMRDTFPGRVMPDACNLRRMVDADLRSVLVWRNHEDVRRWMFSPDPIAWDDHVDWFARVDVDPVRDALIFEIDGRAAGFVTLDRVGTPGVDEWGFYVDPRSPSGTGWRLGRTALQYAFDVRAASRVIGQVLEDNVRSLRLHARLGFAREGVVCERLVRGGWDEPHEPHEPDGSGGTSDGTGRVTDGRYGRNVVCFGLPAPQRTRRDTDTR